jgi:hypothetical protein
MASVGLRQEANFSRVVGNLFDDMSFGTQWPEDFWPAELATTSAGKVTISRIRLASFRCVGRREHLSATSLALSFVVPLRVLHQHSN